MYKDIERIMKTTNGNHFGFDGMTINGAWHNTPSTLKEGSMIGM